jgi:phage-related minor tail protein
VAAVDRDALERARKRLTSVRGGGTDQAAVEAALARTREALDSFAASAAELEATVPERVSGAIEDALRTEVLPVARHIAEVRGLSSQTIRRLEHIQGDITAERTARVEDLALLVDLIASGWRGVERRLDRLERILDRMERSLEDRPLASLYRLEDRQELRPGA